MRAERELSAPPRAELERILAEAAGLSLASVVGRDVEPALGAAAGLLGISRHALVARLVARDAASVAALLESVLVHESHFFRHPEQFEALKQAVFAPAPRARPLALWSAACAAGEEPYTLAMALVEAGREACLDRVVATDVSTLAIAAAREGVYGEWSLRQLAAARRARFFSERDPRLASVSAPIRERVEFRVHELVRDPAPGEAFDVITCRNVLVYLAPAAVERVLAKLVGALAPGGFLVVAPAELGFTRALPLEMTSVGGVVLLRKPLRPLPARRLAVAPRHAPSRPAARPGPAPRPLRAPPAAEPGSAGRHAFAAVHPPARGPAEAPPRAGALDEARAAAHRGELDLAERLASELAEREHRPEGYLLAAAAADARGDLAAAETALRRALYLDPELVQAHAALVSLYRRLGRPADARRARRNALALLHGLEDRAPLPGVEEITVGALRVALEEVRE